MAEPPQRPRFEDLLRPQFAYVWHSLRRLGVDAARLPDATHDVFLGAHKAYPSFDVSRPLKPWLFRLATNVARRLGEEKRNATITGPALPAAFDPQPTAPPETDDDHPRARLLAALARLDIDRRAVVILHDIDEVPLADIAREFEVGLDALSARLRIAREELARALAMTA